MHGHNLFLYIIIIIISFNYYILFAVKIAIYI